jgi:hypothetical protein
MAENQRVPQKREAEAARNGRVTHAGGGVAGQSVAASARAVVRDADWRNTGSSVATAVSLHLAYEPPVRSATAKRRTLCRQPERGRERGLGWWRAERHKRPAAPSSGPHPAPIPAAQGHGTKTSSDVWHVWLETKPDGGCRSYAGAGPSHVVIARAGTDHWRCCVAGGGMAASARVQAAL